MSEPAKLQPGDLRYDELKDIVGQIRETLWPLSNPDVEWDADTVDAIASVLDQYGLRP